MTHIANGNSIPCLGATCRICQLIDKDGPHYREDYRRLFHPEEFGGTPNVEGTPATPPPEASTGSPSTTRAGGCGCGGGNVPVTPAMVQRRQQALQGKGAR